MNYDELKNYTDVYDLQQDFMTLQSQGFSQIGDLVAAMHVLNARQETKFRWRDWTIYSGRRNGSC